MCCLQSEVGTFVAGARAYFSNPTHAVCHLSLKFGDFEKVRGVSSAQTGVRESEL